MAGSPLGKAAELQREGGEGGRGERRDYIQLRVPRARSRPEPERHRWISYAAAALLFALTALAMLLRMSSSAEQPEAGAAAALAGGAARGAAAAPRGVASSVSAALLRPFRRRSPKARKGSAARSAPAAASTDVSLRLEPPFADSEERAGHLQEQAAPVQCKARWRLVFLKTCVGLFPDVNIGRFV